MPECCLVIPKTGYSNTHSQTGNLCNISLETNSGPWVKAYVCDTHFEELNLDYWIEKIDLDN